MAKILWLVSYPKSGNTWFRAFLANLLRAENEPIDINRLDTGGIASARPPLDTALGYDSAQLTHEEIDRLRREYYLRYAQRIEGEPFIKVHDAYTKAPDGLPLFPPEASRGVIYIIRNPLDVCVSFAHYCGRECGAMVEAMGDRSYAMCAGRGRFQDQLRQRMLSWSDHVLSWVNAPDHRLHVMRYEDMKSRTQETFLAAADFAGLPTDAGRIEKAIRFSKFDQLKTQEQKSGFRERVRADTEFFRRGQVGSWRDELTPDQVHTIVRNHGEVMKRFGYLDDQGELLC